MEHIYDTIIIGGGPAGYTAALYASRAGLDTLVIEKMSAGGQMSLTGDIENYPGFTDGIDGFTLGDTMQKQAEKYGAETAYGEIISAELSGDVKILRTQTGEYFSRTVIIATGADPRRLGIPREAEFTGRGVHYCAHCDGRFYKGKTVVVAGGGNSAVSDALYLSKLAEKVILVHRRDSFRASKVYHEQIMSAKNIEIKFNFKVTEILTEARVVGVTLQNILTGESEALDCNGVFVSIGRLPASEIFKGQVNTDRDGYIIAGEDTKTNIPGVFAAGDVRTKTLRQIVTATADGAVAAHEAEQIAN